ncbi:PPR containing protein [Quillaja saponaria]|uniref:PPR containing protein n=1 Tax=Quillaja saponaria TaxID=32244 RepID=A0AAD7KTT8_QUISA|nr:PPR containing protein [Quillaja saponaria]
MSERSFRRRAPVIRRKPPQSHPSPSPSSHRRTPPSYRRSSNKSKSIKILKQSSSEPMHWSVSFRVGGEYDCRSLGSNGSFFHPHSCTNIFMSSPSLFSFSPETYEGYSKDAKVVVNVTVEGSPGAIRTMVKLGSSVGDIIKLVVDKYGEEGRTPKLIHCNHDTCSIFQLYPSYFSLQSLDKSELIGDVGSRSFYLRKSCGVIHDSNATSALYDSKTVPSAAREASLPLIPHPPFLLPSFIARNINKIIRTACRLWKILVCLQ